MFLYDNCRSKEKRCLYLACLVRQIKITHKHMKHSREDRKDSDLKVSVRDTKLEVTSVPMLYLILSFSLSRGYRCRYMRLMWHI